MTPEQAFQNLKQLLNAAIAKGLFENAEAIIVMNESLKILGAMRAYKDDRPDNYRSMDFDNNISDQ